MLPQPGDYFAGRFKVGERLGSGASSVVYAAERPGDPHKLALKIQQPDTSDPRLGLEQLLLDGALRTLLQHHHILPCLELGAHPLLHTVSPRLDCESLFAFMARGALPTAEQAERWSTALLSLLGGLFHAGVVVHDLSPQNLLLLHAGHAPVFVDLGMVSLRRPALAQALQALTGIELTVATESRVLAQARQLFRLLFFALTGCDALGEWSVRAQDRHGVAPRIPDPRALNPALSEVSLRHLTAMLDQDRLHLRPLPEWLERAGVLPQTVAVQLPTVAPGPLRDALCAETGGPAGFLVTDPSRTRRWIAAALSASNARIWHVLPNLIGSSYHPRSFGSLQGFLARDVDGDRVVLPEQMQRLKRLLLSLNQRLLVVAHDAHALNDPSRERLVAMLKTPGLPVLVLAVTPHSAGLHPELQALLAPA